MTILESIRSGKETSDKANFVNLVAVALADGHITHEEYDLLYIVGKRFGANADEVDAIIAEYKEISFDNPDAQSEKLKQFISLIRMMWADGVMEDSELKLVRSFAVGLGFSPEKTNQLVKLISDMVLEDYLDSEILSAIN